MEKEPPKANIFDVDKEVWEWILEGFTKEDIEYFTKIRTLETKHTKTINKTLECSIVELADDIAYATHDLQDVLKVGLLSVDQFKDCLLPLIKSNEKLNGMKNELKDLSTHLSINEFIKNLINYFIQDIKTYEFDRKSQRLNYKAELSDEGKEILETIEALIYEQVIQSQRIQTMEWKGNLIVSKLFEAFMDSPMLLPENRRYKNDELDSVKGRIVCDYIAGMTDQYAENFYRRLYESNGGRLFDI